MAPAFVGDRATLAAGSSASPMVVGNLLADNTGGWRSSGTPKSLCWVSGQTDLAPYARTCDRFLLIGHNQGNPLSLSPQWRVRFDSFPIEARPPVSGITAASNFTGTYTNIDDNPDAPDGLKLAATVVNASTDVRVLFTVNNYRSFSAGAGLQTFRVLVNRSQTGGTDPTLTLDLWDNGTFKANLLTGQAVSSLSGQLVTATWDASSLASLSAGHPQLRIRGTAGTNSTVEVQAVDLIAEFSGHSFDSGYQAMPRPASLLNRNNLYATIAAPSPLNIPTQQRAYFYIDIDITSRNDVALAGYPLADSYFQAARLLIGQSWAPTIAVLVGDLGVDWSENSIRTRTISGGEWCEARTEIRTVTTNFSYLTQAEALHDWTDGIERASQGGGHVFVQPIAFDSSTFSALAVYGTLKVTGTKPKTFITLGGQPVVTWAKQAAVAEVVL